MSQRNDIEALRARAAGGEAVKFISDAGPQARLISNLFQAHLALYSPAGSGPGKGALDLVGCEKVIVRGCRLSALGDTMHIQKSREIVFSDNHITGSRMGAFFLAEYCQNATITGNTINGSKKHIRISSSTFTFFTCGSTDGSTQSSRK